MQTINSDPRSNHKDPQWFFLAEYPLRDFMLSISKGEELALELLFPAFRDLGVPPECLRKMERRLAEFANESLAYVNPGNGEQPAGIRLFCQKNIVEARTFANPDSHPDVSQTLEPSQRYRPSDLERNAGWGYFLIERGRNSPVGSTVSSQNWVDLFIYREGE